MFHVYHLHGGGIRWPQNPHADASWDYAKTGPGQEPAAGRHQRGSTRSPSARASPTRWRSRAAPAACSSAVGDLLEHCHIAEHYVAGMWSFWRVYNTRQPDLKPLPDRTAPPAPVDSAGLIGRTMADGTTLTEGQPRRLDHGS